MKINLQQNIKTNDNGSQVSSLKDILSHSLFNSQLPNARDLYNKVSKSDDVDLSVTELADIQKAVNAIFVAGVQWQVDDIFNSK